MILRSPRSGPRPPRPGLWRTVLLLLWITGITADTQNCPTPCRCLGQLVDCSEKGLRRIPEGLPVWVEQLDLTSNLITNITRESLRNLTKLEELDIGFNLIWNATEFMSELPPNVKKLKMNNNKMSDFDLSAHFPQLVELNLKSNLIQQVRHLDWAPNLNFLDLSGNQLGNLTSSAENGTTIPIQWPVSLRRLKLNGNRIASIPREAFMGLRQLMDLDLSANAITEVEGLVFKTGLDSVKWLHLEDNKIHTLNDGCFYGLAGLQRLTLQGNAVTVLKKKWLYGLQSLVQLNLTGNQIALIDDEDSYWKCPECPTYLEELDLSRNMLTEIGRENFPENLVTLDLSRNRIIQMSPDSFKLLKRLTLLDVSENQIGYLLESSTSLFGPLKANLKTLRLRNIGAGMLANGTFSGLKQLSELDLSSNEITTMELNSFRDLPSLRKLKIQSTSLFCDCDLSGFLRLIRRMNDAQLICAFPPELKGLQLRVLTADQLLCYPKRRPEILKHPETMIAVAGHNVTLTCSVRFPAESASMSITWKKDRSQMARPNARLTESMMNTSKLVVSSLVLSAVDRGAGGTYQCVARNGFGSVLSTKAKVSVHVFPAFLRRPQNITVRVGVSARLECSVESAAKATIKWTMDGGAQFPAARDRRMSKESGSNNVGTIKILKVTEADVGVYTCTAENPAGSVMANATLTLVDDSELAVKVNPFVKTHTVGETAVFECEQQTELERVQWRKDDQMIQMTNRHFLLTDGQLLISQLAEADSGRYQCHNILTDFVGDEYTLQVVRPKSKWDFEDYKTWLWILGLVALPSVVITSFVWLICICHKKRKIRSGGSSTGTDETILPDECNPINGLHPSDSGSLDSPMTDYLAVGSEYSVDGGEYAAVANSGRRNRSYSQNRPCLESFPSESPSFANYLTLKAHKNKAYVPSPHRSCNTLPRALR